MHADNEGRNILAQKGENTENCKLNEYVRMRACPAKGSVAFTKDICIAFAKRGDVNSCTPRTPETCAIHTFEEGATVDFQPPQKLRGGNCSSAGAAIKESLCTPTCTAEKAFETMGYTQRKQISKCGEVVNAMLDGSSNTTINYTNSAWNATLSADLDNCLTYMQRYDIDNHMSNINELSSEEAAAHRFMRDMSSMRQNLQLIDSVGTTGPKLEFRDCVMRWNKTDKEVADFFEGCEQDSNGELEMNLVVSEIALAGGEACPGAADLTKTLTCSATQNDWNCYQTQCYAATNTPSGVDDAEEVEEEEIVDSSTTSTSTYIYVAIGSFAFLGIVIASRIIRQKKAVQ